MLPSVGDVQLIATPAAPSAAVVNPGTDAYTWTVGGGGSWEVASNWTDTTTGNTASVAPGATNAAMLTGNKAGALSVVDGNGNAASLTTAGKIVLSSALDLGSLTAGGSSSDLLDLLPGSDLAVATTVAVQGTLSLYDASASVAGS